MSKLLKNIIKIMWIITAISVLCFAVSARVAEVVTTWRWLSVVAVCCNISFYGTIVVLVVESIRNNKNEKNHDDES